MIIFFNFFLKKKLYRGSIFVEFVIIYPMIIIFCVFIIAIFSDILKRWNQVYLEEEYEWCLKGSDYKWCQNQKELRNKHLNFKKSNH